MRASWIAGQGALVGSPKTKAPFVSGVGVPTHPLSQSLIPRPKTVHEQPDEPINDALDTLEDDINEINHRQISVIVTSQSVISSDPEYWTL